MPKQVDHERRRAEIADALWRIAAERGLEAVSMREVAVAAGVSIGLVQHYFASKDAMLAYATTLLRDRIGERIGRGLAAAGSCEPREALRALLVALLPLDPDSSAEALVGTAVFIRSRNDPVLAERYRAGRAALSDAVAALLGDAAEPGTADALLALVQGLSTDLLSGYLTAERALAVLDGQLALVR